MFRGCMCLRNALTISEDLIGKFLFFCDNLLLDELYISLYDSGQKMDAKVENCNVVILVQQI